MLIRFKCDSAITFSRGLHKNLVTVLYFTIINVLCVAGGDASFAPQANLVIIDCCVFMWQVIKQTVMTTVYGVTKYGARAQIRGQLGDISVFPQKHTWDAGSYLTNLTFKCLQKMFISTKEIQVFE